MRKSHAQSHFQGAPDPTPPSTDALAGLALPAHAGLFAESTAASAHAVFTVTTSADSGAGSLRQAILNANLHDATAGASSTIKFSGSIGTITLLSALPVLNYDAATNSFLTGSLTINGSGATGGVTINGGNSQRVFFAGGGTVTLANLDVEDGLAKGGQGGSGGGGGLGAGGGLFVNAATDVKLGNVIFTNNAAAGGAGSGLANDPLYDGVGGGGGGMAGLGGSSLDFQAYTNGGGGYGGGGGGSGNVSGSGGGAGGAVGHADGQDGNNGGLFGGGAGGLGQTGSGGNGGDFGGGGGGSEFAQHGGHGGFGGGGGSSLYTGGGGGFGGGGGGADVTQGSGGLFAGSSAGYGYLTYGGGGAGLGGAIFVRSGGTLSISGSGIAGGTVTGGVGGSGQYKHTPGGAGQGAGSGAFFQNGVTTQWSVAHGQTVTVASDLGGSSSTQNGSGTSLLEKEGTGTLDLSGNNSFGAAQIDAGTLEDGAKNGLGAGTVTFAAQASATLILDNPTLFHNLVAGFAASDKIDLRGFAFGTTETLAFTGNSQGGTVTVTDGTATAAIKLAGSFTLADFQLATDKQGGTFLTVTAGQASLSQIPVSLPELAANGAGFWHAAAPAPSEPNLHMPWLTPSVL